MIDNPGNALSGGEKEDSLNEAKSSQSANHQGSERQEQGLLPCPFCGGEAAWGEGEQKLKYGNEQVYCTNCYALTPPEGSKSEAAEWWNRRTNAPAEVPSFPDSICDGIARLAATQDTKSSVASHSPELSLDSQASHPKLDFRIQEGLEPSPDSDLVHPVRDDAVDEDEKLEDKNSG